MIHLVFAGTEHDRLWLGSYRCEPAVILYIAEDPAQRLRARITEICRGYGLPLPTGERLIFLIREQFNLMDADHITWLRETVRKHGIDFLVLDTLNRMHPGLDENSAKDMGGVGAALEALNREEGLTILLVDHTRKPAPSRFSTRNNQVPNPFDMKGSVAKYGLADFLICATRINENRIRVYAENKDHDEHLDFLVDVSPKGSDQPKFVIAGDTKGLAEQKKRLGEVNRNRVLAAIGPAWVSRKQIMAKVPLRKDAVNRHLSDLVRAGLINKKGVNINTRYRRPASKSKPKVIGDRPLGEPPARETSKAVGK